MKKLLTLALLGMFGVGVMGCEGSARVGDDDDDGSYSKTTTVKERDGDVKKTEVRREVDR